MFKLKKKSSTSDQDSQPAAELASQVDDPNTQQHLEPSSVSVHSTESSKSKFSIRSKKKKEMSATAASASPMPEGITDPNYAPPPGYLGNLTVLQLHCLEKLKKELKEEGIFDERRHDDATLLR